MTQEEIRLQNPERKALETVGPISVSERAWGTVREDYSPYGNAWESFSHDHARSRAYRWNEDGLAGISDRKQIICFALALWNERDPILKERIFGLTGNEGNHGEDVKEYYFYLDSTPTHSYMKYLYKYPQANSPTVSWWKKTGDAGRTSRNSNCSTPECSTMIVTSMSLWNTPRPRRGHSDQNHGREPWARSGQLRLLPTVWFRNTWSWGGREQRPGLHRGTSGRTSSRSS